MMIQLYYHWTEVTTGQQRCMLRHNQERNCAIVALLCMRPLRFAYSNLGQPFLADLVA